MYCSYSRIYAFFMIFTVKSVFLKYQFKLLSALKHFLKHIINTQSIKQQWQKHKAAENLWKHKFRTRSKTETNTTLHIVKTVNNAEAKMSMQKQITSNISTVNLHQFKHLMQSTWNNAIFLFCQGRNVSSTNCICFPRALCQVK